MEDMTLWPAPGGPVLKGTVRNGSPVPIERLVFSVEWLWFGQAQETRTVLAVGVEGLQPGSAKAVRVFSRHDTSSEPHDVRISARWPGHLEPVGLIREPR